MKNPIIEDFDPEARIRKLGSPLDGMPRIEKPRPQLPNAEPIEPAPRKAVPQSQIPTPEQTTRRLPVKRPYIRRTFDFYEDQVAYLTKASLEERLAGREGSMNAMIREAIDDWIRKKTAKKQAPHS